MKDVRRRVLVTAVGLALALPRLALAQGAAAVPQAGAVPAAQTADVKQVKDELDRLRQEFDALRKQYEDRLFALEQRLSQIGGGPLVLSAVPCDLGKRPPRAAGADDRCHRRRHRMRQGFGPAASSVRPTSVIAALSRRRQNPFGTPRRCR